MPVGRNPEDVIQASGDADSAWFLLRSLISEENTRATPTIVEICKRTQRSRDLVLRLLMVFANARVVREIQEQESWCYELMHEYL
jgi:hypothetical protein